MAMNKRNKPRTPKKNVYQACLGVADRIFVSGFPLHKRNAKADPCLRQAGLGTVRRSRDRPRDDSIKQSSASSRGENRTIREGEEDEEALAPRAGAFKFRHSA